MKRALIAFAFLLSGLAVLPTAGEVQGPYSVEILVDGVPLDEYRARGTTYVEALDGREYSVRLRNRTGRRVAVALSIDGLNTIDAETTTASDASKWILGPHDSIVLDGWQTSSSAARRFFFTTEARSYGSWLGKTDNLGIVSAAFFREKRPRPAPFSRSKESGKRRDARAESEALGAAPSEDYAATGIGAEIDHDVRRVRFEAEKHPAAVIGLRYEYGDALVRLGVLPRHPDPLARRERARGFADTGFAPDPWGN